MGRVEERVLGLRSRDVVVCGRVRELELLAVSHCGDILAEIVAGGFVVLCARVCYSVV